CVALSLSLCYLLAVHLVSYSVLSCSSPPPPSSTLFPYTTLFRSPPGLIQVEQILYGQAQEGPLVPRLEKAERDVYGRTQDGSALDRKSTRLNSSHVKISYAVFCLKKKRIRHNIQYRHGDSEPDRL